MGRAGVNSRRAGVAAASAPGNRDLGLWTVGAPMPNICTVQVKLQAASISCWRRYDMPQK